MVEQNKVAILDAGSQYGKLIDRRVRELLLCSDFLPIDSPPSALTNYKAIIISGGPSSLSEENAPRCDPLILNTNIPILGICYGMQWLGEAYKCKVSHENVREDGQIEIEIDKKCELFDGLNQKEVVLLTHGDSVTNISEELLVIGKSKNAVSAIKHKIKSHYGVQFHPEVDLTLCGKQIFSNFLYKICKLNPT